MISNKSTHQNNIETIAVVVFFLTLLMVGVAIYPDYGIGIDEHIHRNIGNKSLDYIIGLSNLSSLSINGFIEYSNNWFKGFIDKDYGVAFFLPSEILIRALNISSEREIYLFRHSCCFAIFFVGAIFLYKLAARRYQNRIFGLLAALFFVLSPRIFSEAFFNDKDMVFMSIFVVATYNLISLYLQPKKINALILGIVTAIAIDTRIMGLLLVGFTGAIIPILYLSKNLSARKSISLLTIYLLSLSVFVTLLWPWLWVNPFSYFLEAFNNMSKFRLAIDMNFMGRTVNSGSLPWYYIPVWIGVTTPLLYSGLFLVGLATTLKKWIGNKFIFWQDPENLQDLIFLGLTILPVAAIVLLNSVLYNGWRHVYFIYPFFILVAIHGCYVINAKVLNTRLGLFFRIFIASSLLLTMAWMIRWHPYQYLYFNPLAGDWNKNFEGDYWGVAYRYPLEKISSQPDSGPFPIAQTWNTWQIPYIWNLPILTLEQRNRIETEQSDACSDYLIVKSSVYDKHLNNPGPFTTFDKLEIDGILLYATLKRDTPILQKYGGSNFNPLHFSNHELKCFLKSGWSEHQEDWGVWSTSKKSQILLPLPDRKIHEVIFELRAFLPNNNMVQRVDIKINGQQARHATLRSSSANLVKLSLTPPMLSNRFLSVEFLIPDAVSPKQMGMNEDDRKLGIGLVKVKFN